MKININNKDKETYEITNNKLVRTINGISKEWTIPYKLYKDLLEVFKNYCGIIYDNMIVEWSYTFFTVGEINHMVRRYTTD